VVLGGEVFDWKLFVHTGCGSFRDVSFEDPSGLGLHRVADRARVTIRNTGVPRNSDWAAGSEDLDRGSRLVVRVHGGVYCPQGRRLRSDVSRIQVKKDARVAKGDQDANRALARISLREGTGVVLRKTESRNAVRVRTHSLTMRLSISKSTAICFSVQPACT